LNALLKTVIALGLANIQQIVGKIPTTDLLNSSNITICFRI